MTRSLGRRLPGETIFEQRLAAIKAFQEADWREILDFHVTWHRAPLNLPHRIRERWHVSSATYYQRLLEIIDLPEAEADFPQTVRVLRKRRDAERAWQSKVLLGYTNGFGRRIEAVCQDGTRRTVG